MLMEALKTLPTVKQHWDLGVKIQYPIMDNKANDQAGVALVFLRLNHCCIGQALGMTKQVIVVIVER